MIFFECLWRKKIVIASKVYTVIGKIKGHKRSYLKFKKVIKGHLDFLLPRHCVFFCYNAGNKSFVERKKKDSTE